jgi:hypothetical protein
MFRKNAALEMTYVLNRMNTMYCRFKYDREWEILNLKLHRGGRKITIYENILPGKQVFEYYLVLNLCGTVSRADAGVFVSSAEREPQYFITTEK